MHLPHIRHLDDLFELRALCDSSPRALQTSAERFGVESCFTDWRDLIEQDLDAVLVLTSGSHAPIAVEAARAGKHVLVEKPMCYSLSEGNEMLAAAASAGRAPMVGYPKRYDPAYRRAREEVGRLTDLRLVRVTTLESPFQPYVAHYPLVHGDDIPMQVKEEWQADRERRVRAALGAVPPLAQKVYESVLLDSLVHEFNLLRSVLGEPTAVRFADLRESKVVLMLEFDEIECLLAWVDLPGIARYQMEFCFYDPDARVRLAFPSPYLRNVPTVVDVETGQHGGVASREVRETTGYEEPFKLELLEFHRAATSGEEPLTSATDALRDVALCQSVVISATEGRAVRGPTDLSNSALR